MANRIGFAQVERNHMSGGEAEARIHAQLPVDQTTMGSVIENGRFAKYDYATGKVNLTGAGEWEMIYNEIVLHDERKQADKDFAMKSSDCTPYYVAKNGTVTPGEIVPRLIAVELGDIFTTNAIEDGAKTSGTRAAADISAITDATVATVTLPAVSAMVYVGANGYLTATKPGSYVGPEFQVVKVYTLADGQPAVKLMRVK